MNKRIIFKKINFRSEFGYTKNKDYPTVFSFYNKYFKSYVTTFDSSKKLESDKYRFILTYELALICLDYSDLIFKKRHTIPNWYFEKIRRDSLDFVGKLLMPEEIVLAKIRTDEKINSIKDLAKYFDVPIYLAETRIMQIAY